MGCAPAALRMVLAYWGCYLTEDELYNACETSDVQGTAVAGCVQGATRYGFHPNLWCMTGAKPLLFRNLPLDRLASLQLLLDKAKIIANSDVAWTALRETIDAGKPVIAFLRFSPIEDIPGHVVVIVEVTDDAVFFNDPAEPEENQPLSLSRQEFLTAWGDFNFLALVIP
jgi:ABC-type bacteriocin/lantibiotic exporter with double-glycine peptidase domain